MLPDKLYRRLDRARLPRQDLVLVLPTLRQALARLRAAHAEYGAGGRVRVLHRACQDLVGVLDEGFGLPSKRVLLRDRPRPHKRSGGRIVYEVHGECDPDGPLEVYTRTAARAQPVALKSLLDTLLHEWVHHFDFATFDESVHCDGFYERLAQVYRPLRDALDAWNAAEQEAAAQAEREEPAGPGRKARPTPPAEAAPEEPAAPGEPPETGPVQRLLWD